MDLPYNLRSALDETLKTAAPSSMMHCAQDLSQRYRTGDAQGRKTFLPTKEDIIAYAAYRLPATFAAIYSALTQLRKRRPGWHPQTMLDVGAVPVTAM